MIIIQYKKTIDIDIVVITRSELNAAIGAIYVNKGILPNVIAKPYQKTTYKGQQEVALRIDLSTGHSQH